MIDLERLKKNVERAGSKFLDDIFRRYRNVSFFDRRSNLLEAEESIKIFNTIGINLESIYLMAISNGLDGVDEDGFYKLLNLQEEIQKKSVQC
jgi:alanyl-tRNA synthetase